MKRTCILYFYTVLKYFRVETGTKQLNNIPNTMSNVRVSRALNKLVRRNKYLDIEIKTREFKSMIRPILIYNVVLRSEIPKKKTNVLNSRNEDIIKNK